MAVHRMAILFNMIKKLSTILFSLLLVSNCFAQNVKVETGADLFLTEYSKIFKTKKIGLITNSAGTLSNGKPFYKELLDNKFTISAIFSTEHGFGINYADGHNINNSSTGKDSIPIISIYGIAKKITPEMLKNVDVLIFDLPAIGARFFSYISTLFYSLQASAQNNIPIVLLDRPVLINGINVEGPVIEKELESFVGIAPLPIRYGMTVGELANYFINENLLGTKLKPGLITVKLKGWKRNLYFDDYAKNWIKPSPNIPDLETALIYPGTCLVEGTNVSEGRGTYRPFLTIGAPFIDSEDLIDELNDLGIKEIKIVPVKYIPKTIPGMAEKPKFEDQSCNGISITITNRKLFEPISFSIKLLYALHNLYPGEFKFTNYFDNLSGNASIRKDILAGMKPERIIASWQKGLQEFKRIRNKYLLY